MPRKFIKRYVPNPEKLRKVKSLSFLGDRVFDANLWHINRRSVSGAVALGLVAAFVPLPLQMIIAAIGAILTRVNLPVAVAMVWVTNPITIPPIFFFCYYLGHWILYGAHPAPLHLDWSTVSSLMSLRYQDLFSLLLGCAIMAAVSSTLGYISMRVFWRLWVRHNWAKRKRKRALIKQRNTH